MISPSKDLKVQLSQAATPTNAKVESLPPPKLVSPNEVIKSAQPVVDAVMSETELPAKKDNVPKLTPVQETQQEDEEMEDGENYKVTDLQTKIPPPKPDDVQMKVDADLVIVEKTTP